MTDKNKSIVRQICDAMNVKDLGQVEKLLASNYVFHGPGGLKATGPKGFREIFSMYATAFPDMHFTINELIAENDKVVTRWTVRGTHRGDFVGIAPTGKSVDITGIAIATLTDGKVVEEFESFDETSMFRQLGVATLPATAVHA